MSQAQVVPLSAAELASLASGLDQLLGQHPALVADPLTMTLVRLALQSAEGVTDVDSAAPVPEPEPQRAEQLLADHAAELAALTTAAEHLGRENAELLGQLEVAQQAIEDAPEREKLRKLYKKHKELLMVVEQVQQALGGEERGIEELPGWAAQVMASWRAASAEASESRSRVSDLELGLQSAHTQLAEARSTRGPDAKDLRTIVERYEFAGFSTRYTGRRSKKPLRCCPVCGGLDPASGNSTAVGHQDGCLFAMMLGEIMPL